MSNLPMPLQQILPSAYEYQVDNYNELEPKVTSENVIIEQINQPINLNKVISERSNKIASRTSDEISNVQSYKEDIEISSEDLNKRIVSVEKFFQHIIADQKIRALIRRRKSRVQKENIDPTERKAQKKRTTTKRAHNLSKNVAENKPN
ncbi:6944_t:CDS:2 [Gigaspora margarita]|uniref:6944_t:CDS:1 n=1 Tax=Gigaspora margarita TaxID=4874 RepID=A0ABN7VQA6_GIGMA|nr:6944_t:CDS:2 [Gigaspora margarita]